MTKDFADFLESLNREGVAYVVIGGIAVRRTFRIERRVISMSSSSRAWGSFEPEYAPADFISRVPGVEWEDVWNGRVESELLGVPTFFAGIDELIRMKRATGKVEKDLPDVQPLEAIRKNTRKE